MADESSPRLKRREMMRSVLTALGLPPGECTRVVVVFDVRDVPRVYYKGVADTDATRAAVVAAFEGMAVADVTVSDDCEVVVVPLEPAGD